MQKSDTFRKLESESLSTGTLYKTFTEKSDVTISLPTAVRQKFPSQDIEPPNSDGDNQNIANASNNQIIGKGSIVGGYQSSNYLDQEEEKELDQIRISCKFCSALKWQKELPENDTGKFSSIILMKSKEDDARSRQSCSPNRNNDKKDSLYLPSEVEVEIDNDIVTCPKNSLFVNFVKQHFTKIDGKPLETKKIDSISSFERSEDFEVKIEIDEAEDVECNDYSFNRFGVEEEKNRLLQVNMDDLCSNNCNSLCHISMKSGRQQLDLCSNSINIDDIKREDGQDDCSVSYNGNTNIEAMVSDLFEQKKGELPSVEKEIFFPTCEVAYCQDRMHSESCRLPYADYLSKKPKRNKREDDVKDSWKKDLGGNDVEDYATPKHYSCSLCDKSFLTVLELTSHCVDDHGGKVVYKCTLCLKEYRKRSDLEAHMQTHQGEVRNSYTCQICYTEFFDRKNLNDHMNIHIVGRKYECDKCFVVLSTSRSLRRHVLTCHTPQTCSVCREIHGSTRELNRHLKTHSTSKPPKCSVCDKAYHHSGHLGCHLNIQSTDYLIVCPTCEKVFPSRIQFKRHWRTHTEPKVHQCTVCEKLFSRIDSFRNHMRYHSGNKSFQCYICGKLFSSSHSLKNHHMIHRGEKPYKCSECGKAFSQSHLLKSHIRMHTGERPYKCNHCDKRYKQLISLRIHISNKHSKENLTPNSNSTNIEGNSDAKASAKIDNSDRDDDRRNNNNNNDDNDNNNNDNNDNNNNDNAKNNDSQNTNDCDSHSKNIGEIKCKPDKKNRKRNTKDKNSHKCTICEKAFSTVLGLKQHVRRHTDKNSYRCDICGKCATTNGNLSIHMRVHTGEKPYKCTVCPKSFSQGHLLKYHLRLHSTGKFEK